MPEESRTDGVEKFLTEQKSMEDRKQALIDDLLDQREAAIKAFDEKLEKLGIARIPARADEATTNRLRHRPRLGTPARSRQPSQRLTRARLGATLAAVRPSDLLRWSRE